MENIVLGPPPEVTYSFLDVIPVVYQTVGPGFGIPSIKILNLLHLFMLSRKDI
jgi:hypothetical protein